MSETLEVTTVADFMQAHVIRVFKTMFATKATLVENSPAPQFAEHVCGSVAFAGKAVKGAVRLHLSTRFSKRVAAAMLRLPLEEAPHEAESKDAVGELTNILAGGLKSWLCDTGLPCVLGAPTIIHGTTLIIEPMLEGLHSCQVFDCGDERVAVEVRVKFV